MAIADPQRPPLPRHEGPRHALIRCAPARRHGGHRRRRVARPGAGAPRAARGRRRRRHGAAIRALVARPTTTAARSRALDGVDVVVGDITGRRPSTACSTASTGDVDVIHTAGVIHPADGRRVRASTPRARERRSPPPAGRRAPLRARVVEQPVRHEPASRRPVPRRRAVPPVPRLRAARRWRPSSRCSSRGRARARRRDRASAVVLRAVPAAAPDDVLPHGPHRPVPGDRRRRPAAVDGVRRQPRRRRAARRADAAADGPRLLDRRRAGRTR